MAGLSPVTGLDWGREATDWFRARVLGRDMVSLVQAVAEDMLRLVLVDTSGQEEEGVNIAREMVGLGLARISD